MIYTATVTSKRQITLPIKLFIDFGLKPGDKLTITRHGEGMLMQNQVDLVNKLAGSLKLRDKFKDMDVDEAITQAKNVYWLEKSRKGI